MPKSKSVFVGMLALVVVGTLLTFARGRATAQPGTPAGPDVRVVNKPSEPVPVTGNVAISGTPTVQIANSQFFSPAIPFAVNQRVKLTLSSLSGVVDCTVQEIRGEWIRCPGNISTTPVTWINTGQVIAVQ